MKSTIELIMPDYYDEFECAADSCPDTCCAGWQIYIDKASLKKYKKVKGGFGNRLLNSIDFDKCKFMQYDRRCAFLNEDNLCDIYTELGKSMLCNTCKTFPRHIEEYEGLREMSLSLSCPKVAEYLLSRETGVEFIRKKEQVREKEYKNFDYLLFSKILDVKEACLRILRNRVWPINVRIMMVLGLTHDAQTRINAKHIFDIDDILERYKDYGRFINRIKDIPYNNNAIEFLKYIEAFEVLNPEWKEFLECIKDSKKGETKYTQIQLEQLLVYFASIYLTTSIYDGDLYGKMKFCVVSVIIINELSAYTTETVKLAYMYSKELEHSDKNIEILEKNVNQKQFKLEMCYIP